MLRVILGPIHKFRFHTVQHLNGTTFMFDFISIVSENMFGHSLPVVWENVTTDYIHYDICNASSEVDVCELGLTCTMCSKINVL